LDDATVTLPPAPTPPGTITQQPQGPQPQLFKPSFQDASTDQYGNVRPIIPALTKWGVLATLLKSAGQGALDAVSSGSLDAVPGRSSVGAGAAGAVQMPLQRIAIAQRTAQSNAQIGKEQAQANLANTESQNKQYLSGRYGVFDVLHKKMVPGSQPVPKQQFENLLQMKAARLAAIQAAGGDPNTDKQLQQIQDQIDNDSKKADPKDPNTPFAAWYAAFQRDNNREPNSDELLAYDKAHAQAVHFTNVAPGDGADPVMERRLSQVERTSTDALVAHGKNIASRISKLDPGDPNYANQMAAIERDDYQNKAMLAKGYAKQRSALGYQTDVPQFDPWTDSYLSDDERAKLLGGSDRPAKSSGPLPWMKKKGSTTNHLPGNPYAK
jgi:hypothetical protein